MGIENGMMFALKEVEVARQRKIASTLSSVAPVGMAGIKIAEATDNTPFTTLDMISLYTICGLVIIGGGVFLYSQVKSQREFNKLLGDQTPEQPKVKPEAPAKPPLKVSQETLNRPVMVNDNERVIKGGGTLIIDAWKDNMKGKGPGGDFASGAFSGFGKQTETIFIDAEYTDVKDNPQLGLDEG